MFSSIIFASTFVGLLIATVVLWAFFLRFGLRWAKVQDVTTRRIVFASVIVILLQVLMDLLFLYVSSSSDAQSIVLGLVQLVAAVVVPCAVIRTIFKVRFMRALQAWLPTLLATVITAAFALLVLRPFLYGSFVVPANSMAPTLLGQHWKGTCPKCGRPNYCSPRDKRYGSVDAPLMICDNFHVTKASEVDRSVHSSDRFMVAKFLTPRRWDIVVFQYPENPSELYVKRLVGFPGEKIHIQDGFVWVNGEKQSPPDSIQGVEYLSEIPDRFGPDLWGSMNRPALLGKDEYFVLGDFSAQSMDSRLWEQGVSGHNPFAVPESYMKGVVTHTFWPPDRWRIHR